MAAAQRAVYYLGLELPYESRLFLRTLPTLDSIDPLLEAVVVQLQGFDGDLSKKLQNVMSVDSVTLGALFTGLHWFVRTSMRSSLKAKVLATELTDCKMPAQFIEPLLLAVEKLRARHAAGELAAASALPSLENIRWRLDISISTSSLHRVLRPALTMQIELTNGEVHAFHVSKQRFNELRYTAARLLKDMQTLEARMPVDLSSS